MAGIALRPLEFGEVLDFAIELYRRNFATFLGIYAVAAGPVVVLATPLMVRSLTIAPGSTGNAALITAGAGLLLFLGYTVVLSPITCGAMTIAVSERFLGRPASIASAYGRVRRHVWPLIGSLGLLAVPLMGALLAAMVAVFLAALAIARGLGFPPGDLARTTLIASLLWVPTMSVLVLSFTVLFGFVPAAVVLEGRRYRAIWRSLELVWGRLPRLFALFGVLYLMVLVAASFVRLPTQLLTGLAGLGDQTGSTALGVLAMQLGVMLVDPVRMVGVTLAYYDLRMRHEGFDLALLADELGRTRTEGSSP